MPTLREMEAREIQDDFSALRQATEDYYNKKITMPEYKGQSGWRGTFGQRDHHSNVARIRMTGGRIDKKTLRFLVDTARKYGVDHLHFATCQSIQMHDLQPEQVIGILKDSFDQDIISFGTGGNYPRNIMCSPLAGTDPEEVFDVMPYALAAGDYLVNRCENPQMPKKLKTAFSGSRANLTHATYRDLGFEARPDGTFSVYVAGGLGPNPRVGVKVLEKLERQDVLYAVQTMINVFQKYGCNKDAAKRRTRYMVEALDGEEAFRKIWQDEFRKVRTKDDLTLHNIKDIEFCKKGDGSKAPDCWRVHPQKQEGLYTVEYHPIGGRPDVNVLDELAKAIEPMEEVELRSSPFQTVYILNLTGDEAKKVLEITHEDSAQSQFETSVACIGASTCQVGLRDSQQLLQECVRALRKEDLPFCALPQCHISGCRNSCGAHQTARIGFSGFIGRKNGQMVPAFKLCLYGDNDPFHSVMGRDAALLAQSDIPAFLVKLAKTVAASGEGFGEWYAKNPQGVEQIAMEFALQDLDKSEEKQA